MKARVDIEIYERWIARFSGFHDIEGYYKVDSICAKTKKDLCDQIRHRFEYLTDMYLEEIIWERRVKFKLKNQEYDLLIESENYDRLHSYDPISHHRKKKSSRYSQKYFKYIFKEDDKRIEQLRRNNPNIFFSFLIIYPI